MFFFLFSVYVGSHLLGRARVREREKKRKKEREREREKVKERRRENESKRKSADCCVISILSHTAAELHSKMTDTERINVYTLLTTSNLSAFKFQTQKKC